MATKIQKELDKGWEQGTCGYLAYTKYNGVLISLCRGNKPEQVLNRGKELAILKGYPDSNVKVHPIDKYNKTRVKTVLIDLV